MLTSALYCCCGSLDPGFLSFRLWAPTGHRLIVLLERPGTRAYPGSTRMAGDGVTHITLMPFLRPSLGSAGGVDHQFCPCHVTEEELRERR